LERHDTQLRVDDSFVQVLHDHEGDIREMAAEIELEYDQLNFILNLSSAIYHYAVLVAQSEQVSPLDSGRFAEILKMAKKQFVLTERTRFDRKGQSDRQVEAILSDYMLVYMVFRIRYLGDAISC
jgi:hypothetical protein